MEKFHYDIAMKTPSSAVSLNVISAILSHSNSYYDVLVIDMSSYP